MPVLVPGPRTNWSKPGNSLSAVVGLRRRELLDVLGEDIRWSPSTSTSTSVGSSVGEPGSKLALAEPASGQPVSERVDRRRPVRAHVGGDRDGRGVARFGSPLQRELASSGRT
jgi:hypothetical protein